MHKARHTALIFASAALLISFNWSSPESSAQVVSPVAARYAQDKLPGGRAMSFALKSTAFPSGGEIPKRYTCDGVDLSPELNWSDIPAGTRSLALIVDDPDAPMGTWTHWLVWNIPPQTASLPEGVPAVETLDNGAVQGKNDFRRIGYNGPCPPPENPHRYFFNLYALDTTLNLKAGARKDDLERTLQKHVLSRAEWMGTYGR